MSRASLQSGATLRELPRPVSAPNLFPPPISPASRKASRPVTAAKQLIAGLPKGEAGFATTVVNTGHKSHASSTGSASFIATLLDQLDARDVAALSDVADLLEPPGASVHPVQPSGPEAARRKANDAWLARNYQVAADQFGVMAGLHPEGTSERALGLRLRAAALMRCKRFEEAGQEAKAALACLGQPAADPSTDGEFLDLVIHEGASVDALATWQLHGVAHEALGIHDEAAQSFARALLLAAVRASEEKGGGGKGGLYGPSSPTSLLSHFMEAAGRSPATLLPLQVYVCMPNGGRTLQRDASATSVATLGSRSGTRPGTAGSLSAAARRPATPTQLGGSSTPAFRLILRPRFTPWPLEMQVGDLPGVEIKGGTRLSFFCAFKEMPAEPHACLIAHHHERHALVLMSVRIDGQLEVLSNSTEAAWDQVKALLRQPPQLRSLHDFDVVASGWATSGVGVNTFAALVRQKWSEWEEGRGKAAAQRKEEERALIKRQEELKEWLGTIGLDDLHAPLIRDGFDLERLQFISDDDLKAMGVTELGQRRQLMAAVETQQQYKELMARVEELETENKDLRESYEAQKGKVGAVNAELSQSRGAVQAMTNDLRRAVEENERLKSGSSDLAAQLEEMAGHYNEAEIRAQAFARDAAELQKQLQAVQDSNRGTLQELRRRVDTQTIGVLERVRTMQTPTSTPVGKGNVEKTSSGRSLREKSPSVAAGVADPAAVPSGGKPGAAEKPPLS